MKTPVHFQPVQRFNTQAPHFKLVYCSISVSKSIGRHEIIDNLLSYGRNKSEYDCIWITLLGCTVRHSADSPIGGFMHLALSNTDVSI